MKDTIVGISTPVGNGAIGIVRMSGNDSLKIAMSVFCNKKLTKDNIEPRKMYLGDFVSETVNDSCLMVYFKEPKSFTGEDMVEFQLHGGRFLCEEVLSVLLSKGARLAENGEFSKIAFINGKMSLDKAEGIIDLIEAESESEVKAGYSLVKGRLFEKVKKIQSELLTQIAYLEMTIDYPEHDDESVVIEQTQNILQNISQEISLLLSTSSQGGIIKNGINIAIVGRTNVGKSSLLNALIGEERAIVSNIEGTTRDIVKESYNYKGIKFNFNDTAGLRKSNDIVENIGIEKSKEIIKSADLIIFVVDSSRNMEREDVELYNQIKQLKHIVVLNKTDIKTNQKFNFKDFIEVSCLDNKGIDELKEKIFNNCVACNLNSGGFVLTNKRHIQALSDALELIKDMGCIFNLTSDIIAFELKRIWSVLGKITGESENELIIDEIFSRFCLGK